jgi:hypothetical protein
LAFSSFCGLLVCRTKGAYRFSLVPIDRNPDTRISAALGGVIPDAYRNARSIAVPEGSLAVRIVEQSNGGVSSADPANEAGVDDRRRRMGSGPDPLAKSGVYRRSCAKGAPAMLSIADQLDGLAKTITLQRRQGLS